MSQARQPALAAVLLFLLSLLSACLPAGPQPTPSLIQMATPTPSAGALSYRPECFVEEAWMACQDERLRLAFRYPAEWGSLVEARLSPAACGGQTLVYRFEPLGSGPVNGGASREPCLTGAGSIQGFSGFPDEKRPAADLLDRCRQVFPQAEFCQAASQQVWLVGTFPDAQAVCQAAAGQVPEPRLVVAINLPDDRPIGGLALGQVFLSPEEQASLYGPLGGKPPNRGLCRQVEAQDGYQENAATLAQRVVDGQVDAITRQRLEAIRQVAESIQIDP